MDSKENTNHEKAAVLVDSGCDIAQECLDRFGMWLLPLHIDYEEKAYLDGVDIDPQMVYDRYPKDYPKTSTPSLQEVIDKLDEMADAGIRKVIAVCISSGLSGTWNAVRLAALHQDIVPAGTLSLHAQATEGFGHEAVSVLHVGHGTGDAVVEVAQVVIDGAATGHPSGQRDALFLQIFEVHLCIGALVKADNHRRTVLPQAENLLPEAVQEKFVMGHVPVRVGAGIHHILHIPKVRKNSYI